MEYQVCKEKFVETWGRLGPQWGINKTMAQIHALLMVSLEPMCADQILHELDISKANVHMNIKALIDWGLVYRDSKEGVRCEYYYAEKNLHTIFKQILLNRKKRELEPMLTELSLVVGCTEKCPQSKEFKKVVTELKDFTQKADHALELLLKTDSHWFYNTLMKML